MSRCIRQPSSTRSFRVGPADAQLVEEPLAHLPVVVPARVHQRGAEARRLRHRIHQRGGLHGIGRAPATRMIFIQALPQVQERDASAPRRHAMGDDVATSLPLHGRLTKGPVRSRGQPARSFPDRKGSYSRTHGRRNTNRGARQGLGSRRIRLSSRPSRLES